MRVTYLEPSERMYFQMEVVGFEERLVTYPKDYPGDASPEVSTFFCNRNNPLFYDNSCLTSGTQERQVDLWLSRVRSRSQSAYQPMFYIYDSLSLVLSSITPEYKDYGAYIDQIPEDLDLLFADQRTTPTNVQGGYGMIAGKSVHTIKIHIP